MTNGWPERPGVPANPERDGWHWIVWDEYADDITFPHQWVPQDQSWAAYDGWKRPTFQPPFYRYLGPCLLPAEVAALVEEARREEREACAEMVRVWPVDAAADVYSIWEISERDDEIAAAIRARGAA